MDDIGANQVVECVMPTPFNPDNPLGREMLAGNLFGQNQLSLAGQPQTIFIIGMLNDDFPRPDKQITALEPGAHTHRLRRPGGNLFSGLGMIFQHQAAFISRDVSHDCCTSLIQRLTQPAQRPHSAVTPM
jgi:hypothetical protein